MKMRKMAKALFTMALLFSFSLYAGVNLKNGNFYVQYTDIVQPGGGHDLMVQRTYNSQAIRKGWFGFGWGSDFETQLTVSADGSVIIHENGSGADTRFVPKKAVDPVAAAEKVVEAMRKKSALSDSVAADLVKNLSNDAELRQAYARRFNVVAKLAKGTILYSNERGLQELHKIDTGYKRLFNDGKEEHFDDNGKMVKIVDKHGYKVEMVYDKGKLASIKDSQAKQLHFEWYPDGKVKHIWSSGEKKTLYKYEGDDLVESTDISGNTYKYSYDANHNMQKITYGDKTTLEVSFTDKTKFVSEVKSRDGTVTKYKYESNPKNPDFHYWTVVSKKGLDGQWVDNRYEYEIKARPDGSNYTYRILTEVNGLKTETTYSECCSLPLVITRGKHTTKFVYNDKGLLTEKTSTKGEFVQLEYHPKLNKISKVKNNTGWTQFDYDDKGNLSKALNSDGKSVLLVYDRHGRITKMIDHEKKSNVKRTLEFKYNALGKPVEISMDKVGTINVAYDNYGEIKKVESKAGHKMALQVTQAFQALLSIVKPAGVNLNM
jgi:YD repeat-containing protein